MVGGPASIYPVGDPSSALLAQRLIQLQPVLQLSAQAPGVFNLPALFRTVLSAAGIDDVETLVPDPSQVQPMDPVQETMAILTGKPVQAFAYQDQDAHLAVHTAAQKDPMLIQMLSQNPQAPAIMAANEAHIAQHLAFKYYNQIQQQMGVQLPPLGQLPPQVESMLSSLMAPAARKVLQTNTAQAEQQQAQAQQQDPAFQLEQAELQLRAQDIAQKNALAQKKLALDAQRSGEKNQIELERIRAQERQTASAQAAKQQADQADDQNEKTRLGIDAMQGALDHQTQMQQAKMKHTEQMTKNALDHVGDMVGAASDRQGNLFDTAADLHKAHLDHFAKQNKTASDHVTKLIDLSLPDSEPDQAENQD